MRNFIGAALAGALAIVPFAAANAQSGYDTGSKASGTTTNSGEARPDATTGGGTGSGSTSAPSKASPTAASGGSGSGMSRPDADSASSKTGGAEERPTSKAAPTDTKN